MFIVNCRQQAKLSVMRNISQIVYMEQVFNLILKGIKIKVIFFKSPLKTKVQTSNGKKRYIFKKYL